MKLLVGADPEFFVTNKDRPVPAYGMIPGTKKAPHKVPYGAVQVDGLALEGNIEPAATSKEFIHNINSVMNTLRSMVPNDYELKVFPTVDFSAEEMAKLPKEALRLGCDPDFSAYTYKANPAPKATGTMRCAGGHVHVGWTSDADPMETIHFESAASVATQLDWFLGIPSVLLDTDHKRRQLYGKAGAFRPKSYGMEYRVLSNFWTKSDELMEFVFEQTKTAFRILTEEGRSYNRHYGDLPLDIINSTSGKPENIQRYARKLISQYNLVDKKWRPLLGMTESVLATDREADKFKFGRRTHSVPVQWAEAARLFQADPFAPAPDRADDQR